MLCFTYSLFSYFSFLFFIFLVCFPVQIRCADVNLDSILIHTTHEWFNKPTVLFQCKGENNTILPDVTNSKILYTFKGQESWQPLTEFSSKKCKRCKFYEKDLVFHHVFDEWELCPSDFTAPDGKYTRIKEKELNATLLCPACIDLVAANHTTGAPPDKEEKGMSSGIVIAIGAFVTIVALIAIVGLFKYWQKRKRRQEQARFMKLFEEQDDLEDESGLEMI